MRGLIIWLFQLLKRPWLFFRHNKVPLSTRVVSGSLLVDCKIGNYCYIGKGIYNSVEMGNYCSIAPNVVIGGMEHSYWAVSTSTHLSEQCISGRKTIIGHDVWIGANCVVRQGVKIGNGAVIGAGSIVTKDVPENSIVCGTPAKLLRERFNAKVWKQIKKSHYWDYKKEYAREIMAQIDLNDEVERISINE